MPAKGSTPFPICNRLRVGVLLVLACLPTLTGCGPSNAPVSGRVVVTGDIPLGEGKLILIPEDPQAGQKPAGATIAQDGSFTCYSATGGTGVPPGKYKVVVSFPSSMAGPHPLRKTFKKYVNLDTTPLRLEVPVGGLQNVTLTLQDESS